MKTLPSSWQASLRRILNQTASSRVAIVGIGNIFRSDDAAGVCVARRLMESRLLRDLESILVMDAGHAPENGTSQLRCFAPDVVLMIDAVDMGEVPGAIRWIEMDEIEGMSASTHSLPLSMLATYLNWELKSNVLLLGIQPESNDVGDGVSPEIAQAVDTIVDVIADSLSLTVQPQ